MTESPKCTICYDDAIHEIPQVLCDDCFVYWIEEGDWTLDQGCPVASQRLNDHCDGCDTCCSAENDFEYCPIGESLSESWADTLPIPEGK